jgi:hypothetical protein
MTSDFVISLQVVPQKGEIGLVVYNWYSSITIE